MKKGLLFIMSFLVLILLIVVSWFYIAEFEEGNYAVNADSSTCISCHGVMTGLSPLHAQLECISCHKGNNLLADKDSSHFSMIRVPGNLSDAAETCGICHAEALQNINASLMTTNSGIISIDKYIFGEFDSPNISTHINEIHHSPADEHLRALCARCHLGSEKEEYGAIDELSRGGGCNACHLNYSDEAKSQLADYLQNNENLPSVHPSVDFQITDDHCFGCHSRSGRISTNYQGYHETLMKEEELSSKEGYKVLMDDRVFKYIKEDIHHERGLACIDCHGYEDVMGDGKTYLHEEDAVKISCEDCHTDSHMTASLTDLSFTQQRIFKIRQFQHQEKSILLTQKDSVPIINSFVDESGAAHLISKLDKTVFNLLPPSESCTKEYGHQDLTCSSCHTGWAPQCIGCHVSYEPNAKGYDLLEKKPMDGSWVEYAGSFLAGPPTLGVRDLENGKNIEPAIPGMIMTMDKNSFSPHAMPKDESFYRLFAPAAPHTTTAEGRTCTSCHNNALALGYGRGQLRFDKVSSQWQFTPEYESLPQDGLPADAWTGFLQEPAKNTSTRLNFRPFSVKEQQNILTVGACLTCHEEKSQVIRKSLNTDFSTYLNLLSEDCKIPVYN